MTARPRVYIAERASVRVVCWRDPARPDEREGLELSDAASLAIRGRELAVGTGDEVLVFDLAEPAAPRLKRSVKAGASRHWPGCLRALPPRPPAAFSTAADGKLSKPEALQAVGDRVHLVRGGVTHVLSTRKALRKVGERMLRPWWKGFVSDGSGALFKGEEGGVVRWEQVVRQLDRSRFDEAFVLRYAPERRAFIPRVGGSKVR